MSDFVEHSRGQDGYLHELRQQLYDRVAADGRSLYENPMTVARLLQEILELSPPTFFVHQTKDSIEQLLTDKQLIGYGLEDSRIRIQIGPGGNLIIGEPNKEGQIVNANTRAVISSHFDRISFYANQGPYPDGSFSLIPLHNPPPVIGDPRVVILHTRPDGTVEKSGEGRIQQLEKSIVLYPDREQNEKLTVTVNDRIVLHYTPEITIDKDSTHVVGGPLDGTAGVAAIILAAHLLHRAGYDMRNVCFVLTENEEYHPKSGAFALQIAPLVRQYGQTLEKSGNRGIWLCLAYMGERDIRTAFEQEQLPVQSRSKDQAYQSAWMISTVSQGTRKHCDPGLYRRITDEVIPKMREFHLPPLLISGQDGPDIYAAGTDDWGLVHGAAHAGEVSYSDFRLPISKPDGLAPDNNLLHQYPNQVDVRAIINAATAIAFTVIHEAPRYYDS